MPSEIFKTYEDLNAAQLRRALRIVTFCGCMAFVWMAIAIGMPLTMFLEALGASGVQIGMIVAAQQLPLMLQIPSALLVERLPSRKPFWFALAVSHRSIWLVAAALPFVFGAGQTSVWILIATVAVSFVLGQMSAPIWLGWMADLVPRTVSARYWGARQTVMTFTFVATVWASGALLDFCRARDLGLAGFGILFAVAALFGTADICTHLKVPEPKAEPPASAPVKTRFKEALKNRDFVFLTAGMAAWYFGVALSGAFTPICLKRDFGMNYTQISIFIMAASAGAFLMCLPLGRLGGRFGSRTLCALCMFTGPALLLAWFFAMPGSVVFKTPLLGEISAPKALLELLPAQALAGGLYAGVGLYQYHLAGVVTRKAGRTFWMALHWFPIGAASALSPLLGGLLMDLFNAHPLKLTLPLGCPLNFYHVLLLLSAGVSWLGGVLILRIKTRGSELKMEDVFRTLRTSNPFRAVMAAYGMIFLSGDERKPR